ncbi:hypothetical protein LPJ73_000893 [Coemansia sp. RSA 2703]|nr:hypothetical protein LPJ73_000893 [Coemansia sp. RSA 2703]KAJ2364987.1 hypothetical protein IW150_006337 [Coemansia sp. RSA 2607]KAJ2389053.1 hypothetical protein GGI05_003611 [Coemansia sp. RSA 2603]
MGASNSKSEKVYVYANDVPIGFTPQLKEKLVSEAANPQQQQKQQQKQQPAIDTDASGLEEKVDERVARELARILEKREIDDANARDRHASTAELLADIRDIQRQIDTSPATASPAFAAALVARDRVAACLRHNAAHARALDCWREVAEFRAAAAMLERQFAAAGSN